MDTLTRSLKNRFLLRLSSLYPVYVLITVLFFSFSGDVTGWEDVAGTLLFLALWSLVLPHGVGRLLFRPLQKALDQKNLSHLQGEMEHLKRRTLMLVMLIGILYIGLITYLGTLTQAESYRNFWRILEFSLSMVFSYLLIPVFFLHLVLDHWEQTGRESLSQSLGVQFQPGNGKIKNDILTAFFVLGIFPLGTIYLSLGANGLLGEIFQLNPYLFSYLVIVLLGIGVFVVLKAQGFSRPLAALASFVKEVEKGDYRRQTPVVVNNEIGQLTSQINAMVRGLQEKERMRDVFGIAVDPLVRDHLLQSPPSLGGETRQLTILFSDIRGFTALSESRTPQEVLTLLNRYFDRMNRVILSQGGVINKFIGDAILAVFGFKDSGTSPGQNALQASINMAAELKMLNHELVQEGLPPLKIGIGIHTGSVIAGTVGSQDRLEFTVIGDGVNLASRIEGLTKTLGETILFSREYCEALPEAYKATLNLRSLGARTVSGRNEPVEIFTIQS